MKKISLLLTIFTHLLLSETNISVTDGHTQLILIEQNYSSLRFHMEIGDLVTDDIQNRSGDIYSLLILPNFHSSKIIGSPELPEIHQLIQIPHGAIPRIEINNSEVPIMDGSAADFVKSIREAGTKVQNVSKNFIASG